MRYEIVTSKEGVAAIGLKFEGLELDGITEDNDLCIFPAHSYTNIWEKDVTGNQIRFGDTGSFKAINTFLHTLSEDDSRVIAYTLLLIHNRIITAFSNNGISGLGTMNQDAGKVILENFTSISLMEKFKAFIAANVNIPIKEDWGNRPIDREEMTYRREDAIDLHVLVFLSKLMTPIFASILGRSSSYKLGEKIAEIHCVSLVMPLINYQAGPVKDKLMRYIRALMNTNFVEDATVLHGGMSKNYAETVLMAMFLVRNAINHDVYRPESNLITALNGCVIKTAGGFKKSSKKSNHVEERSIKSSISEEQNQSRMEIDSILSKKTSDIVVIAKTFSKNVVDNLLVNNDLNRNHHRSNVKHIFDNAIQVNVVSRFIVQTLFCNEFSGINNMNYLQIREMAPILAATQQFMAGYGYEELTHALTAKRTGNVKLEQTSEDEARLLGFDKCKEYKMYTNLLKDLPLNKNEMRSFFNEVMLEIVTELMNYEYVYQTPVRIQDMLGQTVVNGTPIQFTTKLTEQLYRFLYDQWNLN